MNIATKKIRNSGRTAAQLRASLAMLALLPFFFAAISCATVPASVGGLEPAAFLERDPELYIRLSGEALRDIAQDSDGSGSDLLGSFISDGSGYESSSMNQDLAKAFLQRTSVFGAGLSNLGGKEVRTDAIFLGAFQPLSIRIALAADGRWGKASDGGYRSTTSELQLRPLEPGVIHLVHPGSPRPKAPQAAAAYPARFARLSNADIFIALNSPERLMASPLPFESSALPVAGIFIAGTKLPSEVPDPDPRYLLETHILMKDPATARAYRPVVRFVWIAIATRYFSAASGSAKNDGGLPAIGDLPLVLENDVYKIEGIKMRASEIGALLAGYTSGR